MYLTLVRKIIYLLLWTLYVSLFLRVFKTLRLWSSSRNWILFPYWISVLHTPGLLREWESDFFRNQWAKMDWNGEFNSDDNYIYYCGQKSLRRNGVAIIVNKRVWNAVLGYCKNSKTTEWSLFISKANHSISQ